ncbi:hypothetical protein ACGF5C_09995 [Micromonospora sp. NPDC047620]|uniref:hypothetical protein n=1 Tax=Micromonospora sp. NPDC047620 TaxID=3364251 RepID=UPI00371C8AC3
MTFRRSERPADRAESDRLLDAARAGSPAADPESLARLLSAAAAPARPGELAGEEAALAAFRAARAAAPATIAATRPPRGRRFTAGAVAWAAGIAVTATAGAAFAAVTLDRPDDPAPPPRPATPASATTGTEQGGSTGATGSGGTPSDAPTDGSRGPSAAPTSGAATPGVPGGGGPRPSEQRTDQMWGLCQAYLAKPPAQREKALDSPAYAGVVTAAGGRENVDDFCRELAPEAEPKNADPTTAPSPEATR